MNVIIGISGILAILQSILFWKKEPGISVLIFTIACLLYLIYILSKNKKITNRKAFVFVVPIVLLSSTYFIFNNALFKILNIFVIIILGLVMCVYLCKKKLKCPEFLKKIGDVIGGMFESVSEVIDYLKIPKEEKESKSLEKVKKLGKALLITVPIILVVLALLMSADQVFEGIFDAIFLNLGEIFSIDGIVKIIFRLAIIVITFLLCAGFIINLVKDNTMFTKENEGTNELNIKFENLTINMILIVLNIIYLIFSFIQITNLFMHKSNDPIFDYSSYARQGFFQLMFVSFINFVILIIANINKTHKTKGEKIYNKIMSLLIVIFTIIIILSAIFRMNLYQETYGYTYLRILVDFVLITEAIISIPIIIYLLGKKIDILKNSIVIVSFMYVLLNFMNIDNFIAEKNIDKYLNNPKNSDFDIDYLCDLGTDATKAMTNLLKSDDKYVVNKVKYYLYNQKQNLSLDNMSWQEYNISKKQSKEILDNQNIEINYYL